MRGYFRTMGNIGQLYYQKVVFLQQWLFFMYLWDFLSLVNFPLFSQKNANGPSFVKVLCRSAGYQDHSDCYAWRTGFYVITFVTDGGIFVACSKLNI